MIGETIRPQQLPPFKFGLETSFATQGVGQEKGSDVFPRHAVRKNVAFGGWEAVMVTFLSDGFPSEDTGQN